MLFPQLLRKCQGKTRKDGAWPALFNFCDVLYIVRFVSFCVLFVCKCVLYYCHWVATRLQLMIISYHIISYHIITRPHPGHNHYELDNGDFETVGELIILLPHTTITCIYPVLVITSIQHSKNATLTYLLHGAESFLRS